VERKIGRLPISGDISVNIVDLPGTYSLHTSSPDERITLEVLEGRRTDDPPVQAIIAVVDATNLRMNLRLVLELKRLNMPTIVALNMADAARKQDLEIDIKQLAIELGCPVVETVAVRRNGHTELLRQIEILVAGKSVTAPTEPLDTVAPSSHDLQLEVRRILLAVVGKSSNRSRFQHGADRILMHPVWGLGILMVVLFIIFQAVFSWAKIPSDAITDFIGSIGTWVTEHMAAGYLSSLITDGILSGTGTVLAFLPQILILFFFILLLEDSGYLPRAAFLLDRIMGSVGLSGRAFIPMLSSFACAIPGVMATRSIPNRRDRILTIMLAPLMTCSARLPVYALFIGAFVPNRTWGWINLQGITLFALYMAGIVAALFISLILKLTVSKSNYQPLLLELPPYRLPIARNILLSLWDRVSIFLRRVTGIILMLTIVLWALSIFPSGPANASEPAIYYSFAGIIGRFLEHIFWPLGFNWQISIALVPGMAAREVAVGALGTVYALSGSGSDVASALGPILAKTWSMATAFSLLAWYVYAPQCLSTLAVVAKETGNKIYAWIMLTYMFVMAYIASFVVYHVTLWFCR
jgi:ferrous iron transport protein B